MTVERAFEQFERGGILTSEESRANMAQRKAAWIRDYVDGESASAP